MDGALCSLCGRPAHLLVDAALIVFPEHPAEARAKGVGGYCASCGLSFCSAHIELHRWVQEEDPSPLAVQRAPLVAVCPGCHTPLTGVAGPPTSAESFESHPPAQRVESPPLPRLSPDERHRQAVGLIKLCERDGTPFILYLRDFLRGAREGVVKAHHFTPDTRFAIDNTLMRQVMPEIGVIFVQSAAEEALWADRDAGALGPAGPSLRLADPGWQAEVEVLIRLAAVIIVDAPVLSAGTRFELERCGTTMPSAGGVHVIIRALCRWHFQPGGGPEYCQRGRVNHHERGRRP